MALFRYVDSDENLGELEYENDSLLPKPGDFHLSIF